MRTFWRLLGFLRPYRGGVILSFVLATAAMGVGVLIPYLVGRTIDDIGDGGADLRPLALAVIGAGVLRLAFSVARRLVAGRVSLGVEYDLRNRIYRHLHALELAFFDSQQTGQLMSRSTVDLQSVRFFLGYGLIFIVQSLVTIVIAAGVMIAVDPRLAAISLAPMPFVIWIAFRYGRRNRPASQEVQQRIAELTAEAEENVSGVRVVKAFAQEERQLHRFRQAVRRVFDQSLVSTRLRAFYTPFIGFLPQLGLAAVLFVGGRQAIAGQISVGEFVAFYGYVLMLTSPMRMLGIALGMAQRAVASGARVFELLDREPRLTSAPGAQALPPGGGRVELRDVDFGYDDGPAVLSGVDLEVEPGRTVALVGPTGSGKTTLVTLIPRLYDVDAGSISVDGADVRSVDLTSLRQEVAVVSDDAFLFSASLGENIAYARAEATEEEIRRAAGRAGLSELLDDLPDGLDTLVGERGLTLSGGQRQRVAIARALLAEPRILILDDATSSVDATTESRIKAALGEVMEGRTTFVIAHRLSTIALADEVVVLEDGRVAARGTHEELLERSPLYRDIAEKGLPDQSVLAPEGRAGGGGAVSRAGRLRHLGSFLRPYRARVLLMLFALFVATAAALAPPYLAGLAIDEGIEGGDPGALTVILVLFVASALINWARHLRADLPRQLGRPARAPGPAHRAVRAPAAAVDRLLLAPQDRRDHLAADQRRAGARPAGDRRHLDALLGHAHADRHRRDPGGARSQSRADHLPDLPGPAGGQRGLPHRLVGRLPGYSGADRAGHRIPAGDAVRRAGGARLRAGAAPPEPLRGAQRPAP